MTTRRPNPRVAAAHVVAAAESHDEAIERMRRQLARAWAAGHRAGWQDGVSDATEDDPRPVTANPYGGTS